MRAYKQAYSKKEVERAGKLLALPISRTDDEERVQALEVLEYWKSAFQDPLDEMNQLLRDLCAQHPNAIVVSRIKRNDAILNKLRRGGNYSLRTMMFFLLPRRFVLKENMRNEKGKSAGRR